MSPGEPMGPKVGRLSVRQGDKGDGVTLINKRSKRPFSNSNRHCGGSEAISLLLSEIAELVPSKARKLRVCFVASAPRNDIPRNDS